MKIINGKELGYMPNGTVFSDIVDPHFDPNGPNGDMEINGLDIMCGHDDKRMPIESGKFNGVLHMLGDVSCCGTTVDVCEDDMDSLTDTDSNDYTEDDWVVIFDRSEIERIIKNLQWALDGCKGVESM